MEFRNAVYSSADGQQIDVEINHPVYGWVPFTSRPDDPEQLGRDLYAAALLGVVGAYVEPEPSIPQPYLNNGGLARFSGSPATLLESIRMAAVTRISKGRYRVIHEEPYPTDQYSAVPGVFDPLPRTIRVTARTTSYVEVRVTDLAGVAQDPTEATVKTERVVTS